MSSGEAEAVLQRMLDVLARVRSRMSGKPVPDAAEVNELAREAASAREALEKGVMGNDAAQLTENERAGLMRMAVAVKIGIRLVSRLAAGGARYAALLRSLAGDDKPAGIYGRAGTAPGERGGSVERRI